MDFCNHQIHTITSYCFFMGSLLVKGFIQPLMSNYRINVNFFSFLRSSQLSHLRPWAVTPEIQNPRSHKIQRMTLFCWWFSVSKRPLRPWTVSFLHGTDLRFPFNICSLCFSDFSVRDRNLIWKLFLIKSLSNKLQQ